jgi:D-beta-D-heptose 7-phosphate kinase/D-beta-D-heptose 1-phosphate adenosyltransferase
VIAVIGDIMLDKYLLGSSVRMSPECDTAPVVSVYETINKLGGAGNTALNIKYLGSPVKLFTALTSNKSILAKYADSDITKVRLYSNGAYISRIDYDDSIKCDTNQLANKVLENRPSIIVLSDYNKGSIINPNGIIKAAVELKIPVLVDPKKDLDKYKNTFVLKPNLKEFLDWTNETTITRELLIESAKALNVDNLIVTKGSEGCVTATKKGLYKEYSAFSVKAIDVTGAGDSFLAALASSLYENNTINKAIEFATKVSAIAVTKKGTAYVKRNEV